MTLQLKRTMMSTFGKIKYQTDLSREEEFNGVE